METPLAEGIQTIFGSTSRQPEGSPAQERKIRIAYVTSPRELYSEGIGIENRITPSLTHISNAMRQNPLLQKAEVAAVFVDDNGCEVDGRHFDVPHHAFTYLKNFCESNGIVFHVEESQEWRSLPKKVRAGNGILIPNQEKHERKVEYEQRMLHFMRTNNIDAILSDSYTVLFNSVMLDQTVGFPTGLIINIHPGIAPEVPGVTPNFDSAARVHFFSDDPAERQAIREAVLRNDRVVRIKKTDKFFGSIKRMADKMGVRYVVDTASNGVEYVYVRNEKGFFGSNTGATLHAVDEKIDHGPIIYISRDTPITYYPDRPVDDAMVNEVRINNYGTKNDVLIKGLAVFLHDPKVLSKISENRVKNSAYNESLSIPAQMVVAVQPRSRQTFRRPNVAAALINTIK